ncbi:MAG: 30S ribosomal protein S13 [Candidatus Bipolaricaulia bacterium]
MARIAGADLPDSKRVELALTYIYGIGRPLANRILAATGVNPDKRVKDLSEEEIAELRREIEGKYVVEGDLRRKVRGDIQRLKDINCYRGLRHKVGLPVRGQRTRSNARTWKGPRPAKAGKKK